MPRMRMSRRHHLRVLTSRRCVVDDLVYVENSHERHEYVLNDTGRLYQSYDVPPDNYKIVASKWKFGQVTN